MAAAKLVKDIMTKGAKLVTCSPKAKVGDAMKLMVDKKVSGLPVVDEKGKVVGVVSEADVLTAAKTKTVKAVMTAEPITICGGASVKDAAEMLACKKIKRALVLTCDGGLAGVVSRTDVLKAML
jgi:CBS domain-containing protein